MIYIFFLVAIGYSQSFIERMIASQIVAYLKTMNLTVSEDQILQSYMKLSEIATRYNISITEVVGEGIAVYSSITDIEKAQLVQDLELLKGIDMQRASILIEYLLKNITATQDANKILPLIHEIAENEAKDPDNDYGLEDSEFIQEVINVFSDQFDQLWQWAMQNPEELESITSQILAFFTPNTPTDPPKPPVHNNTNNTQPVTPPPNQNNTANTTNTTEPIQQNTTNLNTTNQESNQTIQNNTETNTTTTEDNDDDEDEFEEQELDEDDDEQTVIAQKSSSDSSALLVIMVLLISLLVLIAAVLIRRHINRQKLLTFKMNDELTEQGVQAF